MPIQKQISVFVPNRPGSLARLCYTLADANINICAMTLHDTTDNTLVRCIVDNPMKAILLLEKEDYYVSEQDVVVVDISTEKGALMRISQSLAEADINIYYLYCASTKNQEGGCVVIMCDNADRALEIISK